MSIRLLKVSINNPQIECKTGSSYWIPSFFKVLDIHTITSYTP